MAEESPCLTGEFIGETHGVLECIQTHPPGNQNQKGPICLWVRVVGEVTGSWWRASSTVPSLTPFPYRATMQQRGLPCHGEYLTLCPLLCVRGAPRQRNVAQIKEKIKTPEKELNNEEVANLSDAEFKTLVIRMLRNG